LGDCGVDGSPYTSGAADGAKAIDGGGFDAGDQCLALVGLGFSWAASGAGGFH